MAAEAAAPERGCYVYGIVFSDVEPTDDATGVGDPPARVEVVRHDGIAALVSEIDLTKPLGQPEDLMAHQQLLDASAAEVPVLPLRFGAVLTSKEAVVEELLAPHCDEFTSALRELEGGAQYVVKGRYVEEAVLPEILSENPEAAELADEIRQAPDEDATRDVRIRLGEIISDAIAAKREADTRELGRILEPHCIATSVREPTHEQDAVHVALLVEKSKQDDLEQAVADLTHDWEQRVTVRLLGPMAPYDFTGAPPAEG
jgi:hypothetical protein